MTAVRRRLVALCALVAALFGVGLVFAAAASAHASVVTSDPVNGSRLKSVPQAVSITFDEPVGLGSVGYLHVIDQSGRRVDQGSAFHPNGRGSAIATKLKAGLGDGTYTESFRIISADSHPVAGTVRFVVGNGVLSAAPTGGGATVDHLTGLMFDAARWVSYAGVALLGSGWLLITVFRGGREDRRARRLVWVGWTGAAVGAVAELFVQGPYTAGEGLGRLASWPLLDGTLHTDYGHFHALRLLILAGLAVLLGWILNTARSRLDHLFWLGLVGVAITFAEVGHAATTKPTWLSLAADTVHVLSMSIWLGGLAMLLLAVLPRSDGDELTAVLPVFSRTAFAAISAIAVTGSYAAWRGVGTIHAVFTTTYGLLVSLKVLLFVGILAVGNVSRRFVARRLMARRQSQDTPAPTERMRRALVVEVVIAIGVLVATSALVAEPRGKEALAADHQRAVSASAAVNAAREVTVTVDPGTHGVVSIAVALSPGVKPLSVTGTASLPGRQIGPIPLGLTANGTNLYGASGVDLPASGHWVFALVVQTSQFVATTVDVTVRLY